MVRALRGAPWWAQFVVKLGAGVAIGLYLVWFLTTRIDRKMDEISLSTRSAHEGMERANVTMGKFADSQLYHNEVERERLSALVAAVQQLCRNTSDTPRALAACQGEQPSIVPGKPPHADPLPR
jgi:hypothetical protein